MLYMWCFFVVLFFLFFEIPYIYCNCHSISTLDSIPCDVESGGRTVVASSEAVAIGVVGIVAKVRTTKRVKVHASVTFKRRNISVVVFTVQKRKILCF